MSSRIDDKIRAAYQRLAVYANQIQALALRNVELEEDARRLRQQTGSEQPTVVHLLR